MCGKSRMLYSWQHAPKTARQEHIGVMMKVESHHLDVEATISQKSNEKLNEHIACGNHMMFFLVATSRKDAPYSTLMLFLVQKCIQFIFSSVF
jgi:hypothetical protein